MPKFPFDDHWYILDADNRPVRVAMETWARWLADDQVRRVVAYTHVTSEVIVSTVFLGLDHRLFGKGPPLLFETMIFGGLYNEYHWRYASWDDAQAGHRAAVRKARKAIGQKVTEQP